MRLRPGMYIGSIGPKGVYKLFMELFTNAIDEYNVGRVKIIRVNINTKEFIYSVEDDGVGIPLGKIEDIVAKRHTGGKFSNDNSVYSFSAGMNGIGLKANNALSDEFHVDVRRDGKRVQYWYSKGEFVNKKEEDWTGPSGTKVTCHPDISVLQDITIDKKLFLESIRVMAAVNSGVRVLIDIDNGKEKHEVYSENGLVDILDLKMKSHHIHPLFNPIQVKSPKGDDAEYEAVFTFTPSIGGEIIYSYVNGLATAEHGNHVTGLRMALTEAVKKYILAGDYIPKNAKFEITGEDIRENLFGVVLAKKTNPLFDGQTKERFNSPNFDIYAKGIVLPIVKDWLQANPDDADKLAKQVVKVARARAAAREARNNIIKSSGTRNGLMDRIDVDKFKSCRSKDPNKIELFIVEGDSAGGTANECRNTEFQAIFSLRGKLQNVIANPTKFSKEITSLLDILDKIKFNKIIIMTDADDDGYHIASLVTGFFYKFHPTLLEEGRIYIALPPLYYIKAKKNGFFVANAEHYQMVMREVAIRTFELIGPNGVKASEELFRAYLHKIGGYKDFLEAIAKRYSAPPQLIELIVRNYQDTIDGNFSAYSQLDFKVKILEKKPTHVLLDFDRGYEHPLIKVDRNFYEEVYEPLINFLIKIKLSNVRLRGIKSGKIYDGTTYDIAGIIESVVMGKGVSVNRFKGLGEMNPSQLGITTVNPGTRNIVQLKMEDKDNTERWMHILLGKDKENKKKEMFTDEEIEDEEGVYEEVD